MYKANLPSSFFLGDARIVAKDLLGMIIVKKHNNNYIAGRIVETEAYIGSLDKASHAYSNKRTKRVMPLYEKGGISYVYKIYGMYYCMNVVTGPKNDAQGVLIRALQPLDGLDIMSENRYKKSYSSLTNREIKNLTSGPGKLSIALDIDLNMNMHDLSSEDFFIMDDGFKDFSIVTTTRIGIDYAEEAKDFLWRYYIKNNSFVSKL